MMLSVIFINRNDQPPSEAALSLQRIIAGVSPVADGDNAYVYVMGFDESLERSEMREPYFGKSFAWNAAESSVVFRQTLAAKPDLKVVY